MRKKLLAANWKMNTTPVEAVELSMAVVRSIDTRDIDVVLCPPYTHLTDMKQVLGNISLGAQNCHGEESGAFTGEVSAAMLGSIGVEYVILGHSERRLYFNETHHQLRKKVDAALSHKLKPIFCCGETLDQRKASVHQEVIRQQLEESLSHLEPVSISQVVIAYEPVWAIGTGEVATPEQAQQVHAFVRSLIAENFNTEAADGIRILYGGSVKGSNAEGLFAQPDIDGGLVGGASLNVSEFAEIYRHLSAS